MLNSFVVNGVLTHSAFNNKRHVFAHFALLEEVLLFPDFFWNESAFNQFDVRIRKRIRNVFVNVFNK